MSKHDSIDYYQIFSGLVQRQVELAQRRDEIDAETAKLKQLILATFAMLPENKQAIYQTEIDALEDESGVGVLSAIKQVFRSHKGEWLTASQVRDRLHEMGFDLTRYRANPMASIVTTLKRMAPAQLKTKTLENGHVVYQRPTTLLEQMALERRVLDLASGVHAAKDKGIFSRQKK